MGGNGVVIHTYIPIIHILGIRKNRLLTTWPATDRRSAVRDDGMRTHARARGTTNKLSVKARGQPFYTNGRTYGPQTNKKTTASHGT